MSLDVWVNGLLLGGMYTVIALGLSLVFGVMRLVNIAHGELLVGGGFLAYVAVDSFGIDPLVSLLIVAPPIFAIAYPVQRYVLGGLLVRGMEPPLVATFGISLILQSLLTESFGGDARSLNTSYADAGVTLLGTDVRAVSLIAFVLGVVLVLATHLTLRHTRFGVALRAAAADPDTTSTMGVNVQHAYAVTFGIAAVMAAVGGVLVGLAYSFTPTSGLNYLLKGFTVVVLGGVGSVTGTLAAGLTLGVVESLAAEAFGGAYRDLTVFLFFLVLLAVRPTGLLGRREP